MAERIDIGLHFPEHLVIGAEGRLEGQLSEDDFVTLSLDKQPVLNVQLFPLVTLAERFKKAVQDRLDTTPPQDILNLLARFQGKLN